MADKFSKAERSRIMASVHSKWTKPEVALHNQLKGVRIRHEMHPKMPGSPDTVLKERKVAVFVHGCFWHKCPKCYRAPSSNRAYWLPKIERNVKRDRKNAALLRKAGWKVIRLWEHDVKNDLEGCINRVLKL